MDDCGHIGPKYIVEDEMSGIASCSDCIADEIEAIPPGKHVLWRIERLPDD